MASKAAPRTHDQNRAYVCLNCGKKPIRAQLGTTIWVIQGNLLEFVRRYIKGKQNYNPNFQRSMNGICGCCRQKLFRIEKNRIENEKLRAENKPLKPTIFSILGDPFDLSDLSFPNIPDNELAVKQNCPCSICLIAKETPANSPIKFGGRNQRSNPPSAGRPVNPDPVPVPIPKPLFAEAKPVKMCDKCLTVLGKGISHVCNLTTRRENMKKLQDEDPRGAEIAAAKVVEQKIADAKEGGSKNFELATGGSTPKKFPVPKSSKNVTAQHRDEPIPSSALKNLKVNAGLNNNQVGKVASWVRAQKGANSFESNAMTKFREDLKTCKPFFKIEHHLFDSSKAAERTNGAKVRRPIVYCHQLGLLLEYLKQVRGYHEMTKYMLKLGADGGKQFLKFCINLIKEESENSSPAQRKTRYSYAKGAFSAKYKGSGVKLSIIIAIVQDVSESQHNLELIWRLTKLNHYNYTPAVDIKFTLSANGMGSASSTYPCPHCICKAIDFIKNFFTEQHLRDLRSVGDIKKNAKLYQEKAAAHKGQSKLSSAEWFNCEHAPLMVPADVQDSALILDLNPPQELHLMLGITLELYTELDKALEQNKCTIRAIEWARAVKAEPTAYHGGAFIGNDCVKLLNGTKKLYEMLQQNDALSVGGRVGNALEKFNNVRKACFGIELNPDYKNDIKEFAQAYLATGIQSKAVKPHIVVKHVPQFLDRRKDSHPGKGLGHWSEQTTEHIHGDFDHFYTTGNYNRPLGHKEYDEKLLACVVTYDSLHEGDEWCD